MRCRTNAFESNASKPKTIAIGEQKCLVADRSAVFLILGGVLLASVATLFFMKKTEISGPVGGH
jgi:hypothetical protein